MLFLTISYIIVRERSQGCSRGLYFKLLRGCDFQKLCLANAYGISYLVHPDRSVHRFELCIDSPISQSVSYRSFLRVLTFLLYPQNHLFYPNNNRAFRFQSVNQTVSGLVLLTATPYVRWHNTLSLWQKSSQDRVAIGLGKLFLVSKASSNRRRTPANLLISFRACKHPRLNDATSMLDTHGWVDY